MIGFGIHDKTSFDEACQNAQGAIIGSAFIKAIEEGEAKSSASSFIGKLL